jgi:hypothetical protein
MPRIYSPLQPYTKFNSLTYIEEVEPRHKGFKTIYMGLFRCDCGNEKIINVHAVKANVTKTCGCSKQGPKKAKPKFHTKNRPIGLKYKKENI